MNLQDSFLNQVRRENADIKVLLVNGTILRGSVKGFDNFTVILNGRNGLQHLIYKHAIAQLVNPRGASDSKRDAGDKPMDREEGTQATPDETGDNSPATHDNEPKPRKEGFNTLDFSHLKLKNSKAEKAPLQS